LVAAVASASVRLECTGTFKLNAKTNEKTVLNLARISVFFCEQCVIFGCALQLRALAGAANGGVGQTVHRHGSKGQVVASYLVSTIKRKTLLAGKVWAVPVRSGTIQRTPLSRCCLIVVLLFDVPKSSGVGFGWSVGVVWVTALRRSTPCCTVYSQWLLRVYARKA
jgi:hypothetical protein